MTTIVWYDRDLRTSDHRPLREAAARGPVVPVYVHSPDATRPWQPGSAFRWFEHHALAALSSTLEGLGGPLVIRRGDASRVLLELAAEVGADAVLAHRRYTPWLAARDQQVAEELARAGVRLELYEGRLLHDPSEIRTGSGKPYRVFTPFWRALGESLSPDEPLPAPACLESAGEVSGEPLSSLGFLPGVRWDAGLAEAWTPSERGAHEALSRFADDGAESYAGLRDRPDVGGTSRLSPHLAHGTISPRQIWHAVAGLTDGPFDRGPGPAEYLRELCWREFAWHVLVHFPHTIDAPMRPDFGAFPWRDDPEGLERWCRGETGYALVDAGMRELWRTGWMHNRVRMVAASFLTKHLLIDWREGARWFWDTLVDADLANNTLGWQWVAGSGADAAPYFRVFNPTKQAERFDPDGVYRRRWVGDGHGTPLLAPEPIVEHRFARVRALEAFGQL